jgi:hypothetical protein
LFCSYSIYNLIILWKPFFSCNHFYVHISAFLFKGHPQLCIQTP